MDFAAISSIPNNYIGAALFLSYIAAALALSTLIISDLFRAYNDHLVSNQKTRRNVQLFSALAALSFATLSYNMLNVLIVSYKSYTAERSLPAFGEGMLKTLWRWMTGSNLFLDFLMDIVKDDVVWWWSQLALLWAMGWCLYMGIEGKKHRIPHLWAYFCLGQIVPVSFTQNLFFLALLSGPTDPAVKNHGAKRDAAPASTERRPGSTHKPSATAAEERSSFSRLSSVSLLAAVVYYLVHFLGAPDWVKESNILFSILRPRLLLLAPLFCAVSSPDRTTHYIYRVSWAVLVISSIGLIGWQSGRLDGQGHSLANVRAAIDRSPAVSALGYDVILSMVSAAVWVWITGKGTAVGVSDGSNRLMEKENRLAKDW